MKPEEEIKHLQDLQASHRRWFSQAEFDRLAFLQKSQHQKMLETLAKDLGNILEDNILAALEDKGYTFESKEDLYYFARTRCVVIKDIPTKLPPESRSTLYVDGVPVCAWESNPVYAIDTNNVSASWGSFYTL